MTFDKLNEIMKVIVVVDKKEKISEEELFSKLKEFLDSEKGEFISFALTSTILDSFVLGESIYKINGELETTPLQENFKVVKDSVRD